MTILLHDRKILIIQTYKTGSRTLANTIWNHTQETGEAYEVLRIQMKYDWPPRPIVKNTVHAPWWKVKEHFKDYKLYKKIAPVRNPWDTVVSQWYFNEQTDQPFNDWMRTLQFAWQIPSNMIFDNGYCVCDEVIRCENTVNDMLTILNIDANKYDTKHENKNESRNVTYQEVHDLETKKLVEFHCFNEITEFGYEY